MSVRLKLILVSIWLAISYPLNLYLLKGLLRLAIWVTLHRYAGLDKFMVLQFLLAGAFVGVVIFLLFRQVRLGHTLAVVLFLGSCLQMGILLLLEIPASLMKGIHWQNVVAWGIAAVIIALNVLCIRSLAGVKSVVGGAKRE